MKCYKIGKSNYYDDGVLVDKNGGIFEFEIIENELKDVFADDALVIVNGKFSNDEEEYELLRLMKNFAITIFIASDIIAFSENKNIIRKCTYLLHQSPDKYFSEFKNQYQFYSHLPEAFYKYHTSKSFSKCSKIIFGGGVRDNEDIIHSYLSVVPSTMYLKTQTHDNRLPYNRYIDELSKHKYAFIISRQKYVDMNWVTPRYVEALAVNTLPICYKDYDNARKFSTIKVFSPNDLRCVIEMYNNNDEYYNSTLKYLQDQVSSESNKFKQLILTITGGRV